MSNLFQDQNEFASGNDEENSDSWIMSYGDLMTVLVVFFLIMISPQAIVNEEQHENKEKLSEVLEEIKQDAKEGQFDQHIDIEQNGNTAKITLVDKLLFQSGKASIEPAELKTLNLILESLHKLNGTRNFSISGHTDSVPIRNSEFPSNWYLSTMRALRILDAFVAKNFSENHLSAQGFAQYKPLDLGQDKNGKTTTSNQAINRRVEIYIQ